MKLFIPARFLRLFFPDLVCETAYELFYSRLGQHTSVGNYWNDPHHQVSISLYVICLIIVPNFLFDSRDIKLHERDK
jgi:palmitoyl-protein thioesterase